MWIGKENAGICGKDMYEGREKIEILNEEGRGKR